MATIHEAKNKIIAFLQENSGTTPEAVRFLKLSKSDKGWEGMVEITEQNAYLQKLGYPTIFDKNRYQIVLSENGDVLEYGVEEG